MLPDDQSERQKCNKLSRHKKRMQHAVVEFTDASNRTMRSSGDNAPAHKDRQ